MSEKGKLNCSTSSNCYAIIALCVAFLTLGLLIGNWAGKCQKSTKCNKSKTCQPYSLDAKSGSTCTWSKTEKSEKQCTTKGEKPCCKK